MADTNDLTDWAQRSTSADDGGVDLAPEDARSPAEKLRDAAMTLTGVADDLESVLPELDDAGDLAEFAQSCRGKVDELTTKADELDEGAEEPDEDVEDDVGEESLGTLGA